MKRNYSDTIYFLMFDFDYFEHELSIDPFIISTVSGMFNMDRGQAMEGIAMWF